MPWGYMGFGMRKEVYTRKPKKPFARIKKRLKFDQNTEKKPAYNVAKEYQSFRFKALYQRRWFRISAVVVLLSIAGYYVWLTVILPYNFEKGKLAFESEGILTYYQEQSFDKIGAFMMARQDKLESVDYIYYPGGLEIDLRSANYIEDSTYGKTYTAIEEGDRVEIHNGALLVISADGTKKRKTNWRTTISINNIKDIHESVFEYLETNATEFDFVLRNVARQSLALDNSETCSEISFSHYYGYYTVDFTSAIDTSKTLIKEIEAGVHLTKRY